MGNDDLHDIRIDTAKEPTGVLDLPVINTAGPSGEGSGSVDAHNRQLFILKRRRQVCTDVLAILLQWPEETIEKIFKRDIVIAGNDNCRAIQRIEKMTGFFKLPRSRALG